MMGGMQWGLFEPNELPLNLLREERFHAMSPMSIFLCRENV